MNGTYRGVAPAHSDAGRLAIRDSRAPGWLPALAGAALGCMFGFLYNLLLGCTHRHKSFPFTPVRRNAAPGAVRNGTYVVCLDCGKTFDYDWNRMRMGPPASARGPTEARPTRVRACPPPRITAITLEPAPSRAAQHRYESARGRVRSLTA
jgi:hypothetical protein